MRYLLTILLFLSLTSHAQMNLVRNPSFEEYSQCPTGYDEISFANYWTAVDSTNNISPCKPEFCHVCSMNGDVGVPGGTDKYYQFARTGEGFALIRGFYDEQDSQALMWSRDYLTGRLYTNLTANQSYCVSFYVVLGEESGWATDRIGAYFDDGSICGLDSCSYPQTQYVPQVENSLGIITDTLNWIKIEGTFTANGTEQFITIGDFYDIYNNDTVSLDPSGTKDYTWILIDDVSVIPSGLQAYAGPDTIFSIQIPDSFLVGRDEVGLDCEWYLNGTLVDSGSGIWWYPNGFGIDTYVVKQTLCGIVTWDTAYVMLVADHVPHVNASNIQLKLSPNPVSAQLTITANVDIQQVTITDLTGREVVQSTESIIDVSRLVSGVYFVRVRDVSGGVRVEKIIKQ